MSAKIRLNKTLKYSVFDLTDSPKTETEEDPCNTNCTAHYMNQNDKIEECAVIRNKEHCFTSDGYEEFYSNIKWNRLVEIIGTKFKEFSAFLTREYRDETSEFHTLFTTVFSIVDNTLTPPRDRLNDNENLFLTESISTVNDHKFCNDINFSFSIPNKKIKEYRIFHIALHSKASKHEKGPLRSKYICKYFEKPTTNGIVEDGHGDTSGPFHYKIDNPNRKDNSGLINIVNLANSKLNPINTLKAPFKKFEVNNNGRFNVNNEKFKIPISFDKILTDSEYDLHNYIYNKFVDFWNNNILPEVSNAAIKIQKHIRGKLTRRGYKKQKSASIKIQRYFRRKLTRSKISKSPSRGSRTPSRGSRPPSRGSRSPSRGSRSPPRSPPSKKTVKSYSPLKLQRSATI
jgi:hypothetical protein